MKKHLILSSLILIPFLASCDTSRVNTPNSPFKDDKYVRIGMRGKYRIDNPLNNDEYNELKNYINDTEVKDINVVSYHQQQEDRDLKYAYFGKESSTFSQCTLTSVSEDLSRYRNRVFTDNVETNKEIQIAGSNIQKTKSLVTNYTFDLGYDDTKLANKYKIHVKTKIEGEDEKVEEEKGETSYEDKDVYDIFGLKPYTLRIKGHFPKPDPEKPDPNLFKLLGDNAVYGKDSDGNYVIREGHSDFINYSTTMGRTYKAVDNYFYEGVLERYKVPTSSNDEETYSYRFLDFRFYHELLILSKAFSSEGSIPILYLEKPALIEFSETTYSDITYCDKGEEEFELYDKEIPEVTPQ